MLVGSGGWWPTRGSGVLAVSCDVAGTPGCLCAITSDVGAPRSAAWQVAVTVRGIPALSQKADSCGRV